MTSPFSRTFRVRWSDLSSSGQVSLASYFHYIVETAWDWGAAHGLSSEESEKMGFAWVIRETEIHLKRSLFANERFTFTIWLYDWRRVRGTRFFELRIQDSDEIVAQGVQQIVALDSKTMRPAQPPPGLMEKFISENPRVFPQGEIPKISVDKEKAFITQRNVAWRDLDLLNHVNNAVYAEYVEEAFALALDAVGWSPEDLRAHQLKIVYPQVHVKYLSPAVWGDKLEVVTSLIHLHDTGGACYLEINNPLRGTSTIVSKFEWALASTVSGETRPLPERLLDALQERV